MNPHDTLLVERNINAAKTLGANFHRGPDLKQIIPILWD